MREGPLSITALRRWCAAAEEVEAVEEVAVQLVSLDSVREHGSEVKPAAAMMNRALWLLSY